ncbi:MAG: hypothetical protein AB7O61_19025 [Acidimicrobiia bacterium]
MSTSIGLVIFLAFLFFATQIITGLYRISTITAEGYSSARRVAAASASPNTPGTEIARLTGRYRGLTADFDASTTDDIVLHLHLDNPDWFISGLNAAIGLRTFDRDIRVRREREVEP